MVEDEILRRLHEEHRIAQEEAAAGHHHLATAYDAMASRERRLRDCRQALAGNEAAIERVLGMQGEATPIRKRPGGSDGT